MIARILLLLAAMSASLTLASEVAVGGRMGDLAITDKGELMLSGDDVDYRAWNYPQQPGKVHVLQYMAATQSASDLNKAFTDKFATDLPQGGKFLSTTILNLDEAMWGTGGMVVSRLSSKKKEFPDAVMVADEEGAGLKTWQLEEESSTIIVTDGSGVILYFKQGAMSSAEIDSTLALIREHIDEGATSKDS